MYLAVGAKGLCLHKRAFVAPCGGIFRKGAAVGANLLCAVIFAAVQPYHFRHNALFAVTLILRFHQHFLPFSTENILSAIRIVEAL